MRAVLDKEIVSIDVLRDVDISSTPPADTNVLEWSAALSRWVPGSGSGGTGEVNTASNINTGGGVGVFDTKIGLDLKFRGINVGSPKLQVSYNGGTGEVEVDLNAVAIDDLSDVDTTTSAPVLDDILQYDGGTWVPTALPPISGATQLDDLSDVDVTTTAPVLGDSLIFDGTTWVPDLSELTQNVDFTVNDTVVYIGEATPGTAGGNPLWRITRTTFTGDDSIREYADGNANFDNVWDNRLSLTYT